MIKLLAKLFVKNPNDYSNPKVRESYGVLSGILGIILNIVLFSIKLLAGLLCGSVSIMADAFNNLSDAGSSIISLIGFKMSAKPVDEDHPFGHGRMEYISGLIVAILIMFVGFELLQTSFDKILNPAKVKSSAVVLVILVVSIAIKLYMFFYNYTYAKKINSTSLKATAYDCISDSASTTVVLIGVILSPYVLIDGYIGLLVALFIFYTGFKSIKETMNALIGEKPDPEFVLQVEKFVIGYDNRIIGIHDLMVHNYGISRNIISMHCEVSAKEDINQIHDLIDTIEDGLAKEFSCIAVIHMDPIIVDDPRINERKLTVLTLIREINPDLTIHDFRMTEGDKRVNLIFDVVVPTGSKQNLKELENLIKKKIKEYDEKFYAVIKVEHSFV